MGPATLFKFHQKAEAFMECQDNLAFMRPIRSGPIQLIVTSPPYNVSNESLGFAKSHRVDAS
jgi:DNA modification methylase